jgi:hypothetical protein
MPYRPSAAGRFCSPVWDPTDQLLYLLFRRITGGIALSAVALCNASCLPEPEPGPLGPFQPFDCERDQTLPLSGLARDLDSLEIGAGAGAEATPIVTAGTPCSGAEQPQQCQAERAAFLDALPPSSCPDVCYTTTYVLSTEGDRVNGMSNDAATLHSLLGDIDTPAEARFVLAANQHFVSCGSNDYTVYRLVPDGVEVRWYGVLTGCPYTYGWTFRLVTHDAEIVEQGSSLASVDPFTCLVTGRRPEGLVATPSEPAPCALGRYFQDAAALEWASVPAFEALARELRALGAPRALLRKVERAIADEIEHGQRMTKLAARHAAEVRAPVVRAMPLRDRLALALDNAVEGCVRETFGAVLATYQAAHAQDGAISQTFAKISVDETRHASLAWQLQAWLEAELTPAQRARVRAAQRAAIEALERELELQHEPALRTLAGLPDAPTALSLHAELTRTLWARPLAAA